jgi:hypothetical protein
LWTPSSIALHDVRRFDFRALALLIAAVGNLANSATGCCAEEFPTLLIAAVVIGRALVVARCYTSA